jgi:tetraacyldisaccharide 4'-kinase
VRRPLLWPLTWAYRAVVKSRNYAFDHEPYRVFSLKRAVVSVGSLSAGGAGKTPVVAALAELLLANGYTVDVLTRGYGRRSKVVERVELAGPASRFGDEALMLARTLPSIPVFVGVDRLTAGELAERSGGRGRHHLHLLDDGFQHRRLRRSVDVVLLTREDIRDHLLPAGNLREPLENLARADAVLLREDEAEELCPVVKRLCGAETFVWVARRVLSLQDTSKKPFAFCGLARPKDFFAMLRGVSGKMAFRDHHRYKDADITALLRRAKAAGAEGWVTTAKDFVKLNEAMLARLREVGPVTVAELRVEFDSSALVLEQLEQLIVKDLHG